VHEGATFSLLCKVLAIGWLTGWTIGQPVQNRATGMCLLQTHANLRVRCTCLVACNVMRCLPHSTINLCSGRESTRGHHLPPPQPTAERPVRAVSRHHQEALNVARHRFWHWFSQSGLGEVARTMQSTTDLKHDAGPCIRCCRASWLFFRIHSHVYCTTICSNHNLLR